MTSSGGPFSNAARNLRQLGSSPASWAYVGVVLGIQCMVSAGGGPLRPVVWRWFELLGLNREGILSGKIWQIFSYGFLHGSWFHVGMNALLVLLVGSRVEYMAGRGAMAKAVIFGILGGGVGHLLLAPGGQGSPLLVGLSGGCLALLLLLTTLSPQSRMLPILVSGRSLGVAILAVELVSALMNPEMGIPGFSSVGKMLIDHGFSEWFMMGHACHFGGGLAGWGYGRWLLRPRITLKRLRRDRERREASEVKRAD
jgi:membrane associated rhomboid family serine protease